MKKTLLGVFSGVACALCAFSQAPDPLTPSEVTPKQIGPRHGQVTLEQKSPRHPGGDKPLNPDQPNLTIKGIILVTNRTDIKDDAAPVIDVEIKDPALDRLDLKSMLAERFIGKPITENNIRDLQDAIILYWRNHGKILLDAILPEQSIEKGVLQIWLLEGKVGKVTVNNPGTRWFKDKFFLDSVRLRPGGELDGKEFNEDLNWVNNNPFRQVDVSFKPGEKLGLTDVQLNVEDRIPIRPYVGYEDSGTRFTGPDRFLVGLNWGNAFWLDHQFNYQYAADTDFRLVAAHSASYLAPLPWRHTLMVYGSYVDAKADLGLGTSAEGHSWQTSLRYSIPLPQIQKFRHQVALGFDFKRSNNNLLAGGSTPTLAGSDTDVDQFAIEYTGLLPDPWGRTSFGGEAYYSPGGLTDHNHDPDFDNLRLRARAEYYYFRFNAERITRLPMDFSFILRGWAQYTPKKRLLPSEEFAIGGYSTVRGYDERVILGDSGWVVNAELRTMPFHILGYFHLPIPKDELQFLGFFDYGGLYVNDKLPTDADNNDKVIYSVGAGLRYAVGSNVSFRFDYGYPLHEAQLNEHRNGRVHLGALVSF